MIPQSDQKTFTLHQNTGSKLGVLNPDARTAIHGRKEAEIKLNESEQRYYDLTDALPLIVWTAQPDGTLDYLNQYWSDYTGMTFEEAQEWGWQTVLHPDDVLQYLNLWGKAIRTGEAYEIEYRFKCTDGTYRWHLGRAIPARDESGQITAWVGTCTDIDDQKQAEAECVQKLLTLQEANEQLHHVNKVQSDFVSMVSHEFRTTLTSIQGFSELMRDEDFNLNEIKEYAADINADALRLDRMITELLDLERMKSGRMTLNLNQVDLNALIIDVVDRARPTATHHSFHLQLDDRLPLVSGDNDKLTQVVANLVSNAVKYSPVGGEIILTSQREDDLVHVRVQDNGIGIPSQALEQVFDPYSRIESDTTRYIKGTGLGLPIVRQIVQMHGGQAWAESTLGHGSVFHFTILLRHSNNDAIPSPLEMVASSATHSG